MIKYNDLLDTLFKEWESSNREEDNISKGRNGGRTRIKRK